MVYKNKRKQKRYQREYKRAKRHGTKFKNPFKGMIRRKTRMIPLRGSKATWLKRPPKRRSNRIGF